MKLLSYRAGSGAARVGVLVDGRVVDIDDQVAQLAVPQAVADYRADEPRLIKRCQVAATRFFEVA